LLPIGNKNDVALHIASLDSSYRNLFFCNEWRVLEKNDISEDERKEIEKRVYKYTEEAKESYSFTIAEALLSYPTATTNTPTVQKSVPFIKGIQIGLREMNELTNIVSNAENSSTLEGHTLELQLDYWFPKKKGEGHKEVKSFQYVCVTKLPAVASALHIEPESRPTSSTFSMSLQSKDKSKKDKMKEALTSRFGKEKKEESGSSSMPVTSSRVNRIMCSSADDSVVFKVVIDGIEWAGVKFVSISSQWQSHIKSFPIQAINIKS